MVGSMLPTSMAPLEGGFKNAEPMLLPLLIEGTLPDVNGKGNKVGMVMMTGDDYVGGDGTDKAVGSLMTTPPTIPLSAPIHHHTCIAWHAPQERFPSMPPSLLSSPMALLHGPLKARLCPAKLS